MKLKKGDRLHILLNLPRGERRLEETSNVLEGTYIGTEKIGFLSRILKLCNVNFRGMKSEIVLVPSMFVSEVKRSGSESTLNMKDLPIFEYLLAKNFFKISTVAFGFYIARFNTFFGDHKWNLLINGNTMASPSILLSAFVPRSPLESYTDYVISIEHGETVSDMVNKMKELRNFIDYSIAKAGCLILLGRKCRDDAINFAKTKFFEIWECEDMGTLKSSLNLLQGTKYICGALVNLDNKEFYIPDRAPLPKVLFNILKNTIPRTLKSI